MYDAVVTSGCSFSEVTPASVKTWPVHLENFLGVKGYHSGQGASGNRWISSSMLYNISRAEEEGKKNILAVVEWSGIHRCSLIRGYDDLQKDATMHKKSNELARRKKIEEGALGGHTTINYKREFTESGWVSLNPWFSVDQLNVGTEEENRIVYQMSDVYFRYIQNTFTDIIDTFMAMLMIDGICKQKGIRLLHTFMTDLDKETLFETPDYDMNVYAYRKHAANIKFLPCIRQTVETYEKNYEDPTILYCENDFRGHPSDLGHELYFNNIIKPEL